MIKLILEIKEETNENFKNVKAVGLNVDVQEIQINATEGELKGSKFIKNQINIDKKLQIINESKIKNETNKEKADRIVNELFKEIFSI